MPVYEYHCESCDDWVDYQCSVSDMPSLLECDGCDGFAVRKIGSPPKVAIPAKHQAAGSVLKKFGITNPVTGEGLKPKKREI